MLIFYVLGEMCFFRNCEDWWGMVRNVRKRLGMVGDRLELGEILKKIAEWWKTEQNGGEYWAQLYLTRNQLLAMGALLQ